MIYDVADDVDPPEMTIIFFGQPPRLVTVRLKEVVDRSPEGVYQAALRQHAEFTLEQLELLRECAKPMGLGLLVRFESHIG
jgi:hypothetical protein